MSIQIPHFINGQKIFRQNQRSSSVFNPSTGDVSGTVSFASATDVDKVVQCSAKAFENWKNVTPSSRAKILFRFLRLIEDKKKDLAELISQEHGKSITESLGSLSRGMDVLEFACGIPYHLKGDFTENVGRQVDSYSIRQPLGVCVAITPFNFPAMIPLWTMPMAVACGNTFILKPSERNPSCSVQLAELALEAGLPEGVFNVIQGDKETVTALLSHPLTQAITFVGQTSTAEYVHQMAIQYGKRVQAFGGAKNHMIIMPDADLDQTVDALIGSAYGSAGQRCMAISVAVIVGDKIADSLIDKLIHKVRNLKIGPYTDPQAEIGPIITKEQLEKIKNYVEIGVQEGASLLVDGRHLSSHSSGFFMGPCLFDYVKKSMKIYQEEIFGPVLCVVRVPDYESALDLANTHRYGNGVAIFTQDGDCARDFCSRVQVGMVGVNVSVPVPVAYHSFGGWKKSVFSDIGLHGTEGVRFYTKLKTITERWSSGIRSGIDFSLPTVG